MKTNIVDNEGYSYNEGCILKNMNVVSQYQKINIKLNLVKKEKVQQPNLQEFEVNRLFLVRSQVFSGCLAVKIENYNKRSHRVCKHILLIIVTSVIVTVVCKSFPSLLN